MRSCNLRQGDSFSFYFETSGGDKGAGVTGNEDDRYYQSGKLLAAGSDERYQVVVRKHVSGAVDADGNAVNDLFRYYTLDDVDAIKDMLLSTSGVEFTQKDGSEETYRLIEVENVADVTYDLETTYNIDNLNKDAEDLDELYIFQRWVADEDAEDGGKWVTGVDEDDLFLVNTSGRVVDNRGRSKDGNDYYFVTGSNGMLTAIYLED